MLWYYVCHICVQDTYRGWFQSLGRIDHTNTTRKGFRFHMLTDFLWSNALLELIKQGLLPLVAMEGRDEDEEFDPVGVVRKTRTNDVVLTSEVFRDLPTGSA